MKKTFWDSAVEETVSVQQAQEMFQKIIGLPVGYVLESEGIDLLDIGFGECVASYGTGGRIGASCPYALHITSPWQIRKVDIYSQFEGADQSNDPICLKGNTLHRVMLSENNSLVMGIGEYLLEINSSIGQEEAWCYISKGIVRFHLVATGTNISLWQAPPSSLHTN